MIKIDDDGHWWVPVKNKSEIVEELKAKRVDAAKISVKEQIALDTTKGRIAVKKIQAEESSKEVAGKHLAKMGAFYLLVLVLAFIWAVQSLPNEAIAVVAGLITLVVTNLSTILKGIVETKEQKDPIELMYDIAEKNSESCEREHLNLVDSTSKAQATLIQAAERQQAALLETASANHREMVAMLKESQEKQPTSLSIQPDNVVIKQGDNTVETSTKPNGNPPPGTTPPSTSPPCS